MNWPRTVRFEKAKIADSNSEHGFLSWFIVIPTLVAGLAFCYFLASGIVTIADRLWFWEDDLIPQKMHAKPVYHYSHGFGPGGGCAYVVYSLPSEVSETIRGTGIAYFKTMPQPEFAASDHNPYGAWQMTPAPPPLPLGKPD